MTSPRKTLFDRLPELYHRHDQAQQPPDQLKAYVEVLDEAMSAVHENIEALYHDFFIETCDDWVVAYLADLLGTSHLFGDPWTLRADVARTVHHRRRKGTLGAIESLTYVLSGWAVHSVELRERMLWNQHLNHQRPDVGGQPPLRMRNNIVDAVRGGTVSLRDPAVLSFVGKAFDPFARLADVKPVGVGQLRANLPNLAIFLWRLEAYHLDRSRPICTRFDLPAGHRHEVDYTVRCYAHPMAEPMTLFNVHHYFADEDPPNLANEDAVPGPIATARLSQDAVAGRPEKYVHINPFDPALETAHAAEKYGLVIHMPLVLPVNKQWKIRGANLCAWENGLFPPLREYEIVIDPVHGRLLFGLKTGDEANTLRDELLLSPTYGFSGPTGAHPIGRSSVSNPVVINRYDPAAPSLQSVLDNIDTALFPLVIEIRDSQIHELNLASPLKLKGLLHIRAASGQRPVIVLASPMNFRVHYTPAVNPQLVAVSKVGVTLEGLYLTRQAGYTGELIGQAAVNRLRIESCTLDPGGSLYLDGSFLGGRTPIRASLNLNGNFNYSAAENDERDAFLDAKQIPVVEFFRSISGPLHMDDNYTLTITASILDAGAGVDDPAPALAVRAATGDPELQWGPPLTVLVEANESQQYSSGLTCFGRMRVQRASGEGGIWVHRLEVHDNQFGCLKFSYFSGNGDRLPPNHGCVFGTQAELSFASEMFGEYGYGQIHLRSDSRILEQGPGHDAMGAFGYLQNSHKWKNINIRYREYMPVGIRPVLITVT